MIPGSFLDSSACLLLFEQQSGKRPSDTKISERWGFLKFFYFFNKSSQTAFSSACAFHQSSWVKIPARVRAI